MADTKKPQIQRSDKIEPCPDALLDNALTIAARMGADIARDRGIGVDADDCEALIDKLQRLDAHIRAGGDLPKRWVTYDVAPVGCNSKAMELLARKRRG